MNDIMRLEDFVAKQLLELKDVPQGGVFTFVYEPPEDPKYEKIYQEQRDYLYLVNMRDMDLDDFPMDIVVRKGLEAEGKTKQITMVYCLNTKSVLICTKPSAMVYFHGELSAESVARFLERKSREQETQKV